jgi:hypothetical protein
VGRRPLVAGTLTALAAALLAAGSAQASDAAPSRYSLAGGCWSLEVAQGAQIPGADRLRLQATDLGSYLLYTQDGKFLAAQGDGQVAPDDEPSPDADWRVTEEDHGIFSLAPLSGADTQLAGQLVTFEPADGCAAYPEAQLNARGRPDPAETGYGEVGGLLEGHMHWMNHRYFGGEFHCGRPWHRYGIPYALPDCAEIEGPNGSAAPLQNFFNFGSPVAPHDTTGWPKLTEWRADNLTYEGNYWKWIERAWLGGLRLMVMSINENRVLCQVVPRKKYSCNEMQTVRDGFREMYELERYADAQAGGPGKGFFEIVTNPYDARRVINEGRMAVVLEIEISELFDCRSFDNPTCSKEQVKAQLDEMYDMGVRSSLLVNKFDSGLAGVRFDSGAFGLAINAGNRESSGSFWSAETCKGDLSDNTIETGVPEGSATLDALLAVLGTTRGEIPSYPPAPHCNTRGLTELGRYVVKEMIERNMLVNPDHMSQRGVDEVLTIAEANDYSGVITSHDWVDPGNYPRFFELGGLAFPDSSATENYIDEYESRRPKRTPYEIGWGYGADLGGLTGGPEAPGTEGEWAGGVTYPFKSYDGEVTFERQTTGERTFDYPTEGVAHYGLYSDWFEDLQNLGPKRMSEDMWNAPEAYLQMWERAEGIRSPGCKPTSGKVTARGLGRIALGERWERLLRRAGQPQQRDRVWSWCVRGPKNRDAADVAELDKKGRVELAGSTANGRAAGGVAVGNRATALDDTRAVGNGVHVSTGGPGFVYAVRGGRVDFVGVAADGLAGKTSKLRTAVRRARKAEATNEKRKFVPNPSPPAEQREGSNFSLTSDPETDRAFQLLCQLGTPRG